MNPELYLGGPSQPLANQFFNEQSSAPAAAAVQPGLSSYGSKAAPSEDLDPESGLPFTNPLLLVACGHSVEMNSSKGWVVGDVSHKVCPFKGCEAVKQSIAVENSQLKRVIQRGIAAAHSPASGRPLPAARQLHAEKPEEKKSEPTLQSQIETALNLNKAGNFDLALTTLGDLQKKNPDSAEVAAAMSSLLDSMESQLNPVNILAAEVGKAIATQPSLVPAQTNSSLAQEKKRKETEDKSPADASKPHDKKSKPEDKTAASSSSSSPAINSLPNAAPKPAAEPIAHWLLSKEQLIELVSSQQREIEKQKTDKTQQQREFKEASEKMDQQHKEQYQKLQAQLTDSMQQINFMREQFLKSHTDLMSQLRLNVTRDPVSKAPESEKK